MPPESLPNGRFQAVPELGHCMGEEQQKNIIAIDDSVSQLKIFQKLLGSRYNLALVKSASEAIILLKTKQFDLILLDIEMPDISGFEFLHEIRKIPQYMLKPVLIVTSHSESDFLSHAKHSSASGVINKPVNAEDLINAIETALASPVPTPYNL